MTDPMAARREILERARSAKRAGDVLSRAGEVLEADLAYDRARSAYALLVDDAVSGASSLAHVDQMAERSVLGSRAALRRRMGALVILACLLAATLGYVAFALGARPFANVVASATFDDSPMFGPRMAVDGNVDSEWLLPDQRSGSLDLTLFPARDVRRVIVTNGHNRHFLDRAVRRFEVQLFRDGVKVRVVRGTFDEITAPGERRTLAICPVVRDVDHVRFVAVDHHGLSAALAEIEVR